MLLNLTELSTEPLHNQISRQIWGKILAGDITGGSDLLPVRTLARTHHISPLTVGRAYKDLENEGIITSNNGKDFTTAFLTAEERQRISRRRLFEINSPLSVIDAFSNQLSSVFDPEKLRGLLEKNIKEYLRIKSVHFILLDDRTNGIIMLPSEEFPERYVISEDDGFFSGTHST